MASPSRAFARRILRSSASGRVWTALAPLVGRVAGRVWSPVPGRVVLVPPAAPGSLGDDALITVLSAGLGHDAELQVVDVSRHGDSDMRAALHGFPLRGWLALLRARPETIAVVGADVMNGHYSDWLSARRWNLLACASAAGIDAVAVGYSWPEPEACGPQSVRAAQAGRAVRRSCRDPLSARRFTAATGRPVLTGADVAFLLEPDASGERVAAVRSWADRQRRAGRRPVALNLNGLTLGSVDAEADRLAAVVAAVVGLAADDIAVLLVPHDRRDAAGDRAWAEAVGKAVADDAPDTFVADPVAGAEAKAMLGLVDAAVTGRMHVAIACLSCGVPVSLLDYQGKVAGLDELFPGARIATTVTADDWCRDLADLARELVATAPARRSAIADGLDAVRRDAQRLVDDARAGVST